MTAVKEGNTIPANGLSAALRDPDRRLLGTVASSADPVFVELAATKFDLIWIDLEHSALSLRDVQTLVIAVKSGGAFSLVRLPAVVGDVGALLDTGTDGLVLPRVESVEALAHVADQLDYPPGGRRGYAPRRAALTNRANPQLRPALVAQLESPHGLEIASDVAAVDGCDALVVGTSDLSHSLGVPLEFDNSTLADSVERVREAAAAEHKGWGLAGGGTPAQLHELAGSGGYTLVHGSDLGTYATALAHQADALYGAT